MFVGEVQGPQQEFSAGSVVKLQRMSSGLHICPQVTWDCSLIGKIGRKIMAGGGEKFRLSFMYGPRNC